jgi:uncharacterized protein (TIGR02284 family)
MSAKQETTQQLEELFNRTINAREAYKNASKNVHNKPLTVFFEEAALKHEQFSKKLQEEIHDEGGKTEENVSLRSEADRFWLDFASIIVRRNESAILRACVRAEEEALAQYTQVLKQDVPERIREDIEQQKDYAESLLQEVNEKLAHYKSD